DFKDFFPSIKWHDLKPILQSWHASSDIDWELDADAENLIRRSCFYLNDALPIGYPSSPIISNVVMFSLDVEISSVFSDSEKYGNVVYTRYADDIVLSTDKKGMSKDLISAISGVIMKSTSPVLLLNPKKTKIGSSSGGTATVTGIRVCNDGHLTIHRHHKDHIRLLLSLYKKGSLNKDEHSSLLGHLSYVQYIAPSFYSKLQKKYFKEIAALKEK
ncbi:MAG: RNA-directed DNA polymerase, partial [Sedimenticola thiotaurini]